MSLYKKRMPTRDDGTTYLGDRQFNFVGMTIAGLQQINEALRLVALNTSLGSPNDTVLTSFVSSLAGATKKYFYEVPSEVYKHIKPYGVYNNRGTHDGQERFSSITNSNVGNIIGVNISNYVSISVHTMYPITP